MLIHDFDSYFVKNTRNIIQTYENSFLNLVSSSRIWRVKHLKRVNAQTMEKFLKNSVIWTFSCTFSK